MKKQSALTYIAFSAIVLLSIFACNSWKVFSYPPRSVHQWRQSDCAAYVKTYYRTGSSLMQPATYNLAGKHGRVISEFPVIYYVSAKLQHWIGEHYWVVRGITFLCFLTGLAALLSISRRWIKDPVLALFPVVLLASSPYYYYYAINFLPNVPAISFSLLGLACFLKYTDRKKIVPLLSGTLFLILATLLKPTDAGLLWLSFMAALICTVLKAGTDEKKTLKPLLLASLLIAFCNIAWIKYVNGYNDLNGNHQNLIGIYPIWDMSKDMIQYTAIRVVTEWSNVYQQKLLLLALAVAFVVFIWKWKRLDTFLKWFTFWALGGALLYSILWFKAYTDHDYYQLPVMLPAICLCITVLAYVQKEILAGAGKRTVQISYGALALLAIVGIYHNRNVQKERYTKKDYVYANPALYEIEPYLKSIGVGEKDAVVCVPDKSPNISLNAINRYGYTEEFNSDAYNIHTFKMQGAAYLLISDKAYLTNPLYIPFTGKKIGEYKDIYIFDIR